MTYDVVIVGAGPSGLSAAIRLKQLAARENRDISVCILEKGAAVGAHILSGAVLEPRALEELIPGWQEKGAPLQQAVTSDHFCFLSATKTFSLPTPPAMKNHGNYIISLGKLCQWLAIEAESLGVEIYPGFAACDVLYEDNKVIGVATGDMGVGKDGKPTEQYQAGINIFAKQTLLAEGCRGHLSERVMGRFDSRKGQSPQTYGIGIKEVWQVPEEQCTPGKVIHTIGWPLDGRTYGGSFIYHLPNNQISIGFVVGLDYENPYLSPFDEMQRFKHHPFVAKQLAGGKRISYGARALNEGGLQSLPKLSFPGGLFIGCSAGFMNVPKIKGTHTAMKSGMLAAETIFENLDSGECELVDFNRAVKRSWIWRELKRARNIRPAFRFGRTLGLLYAAIDSYLLRGRAPWTLKHHHDYRQLKQAKDCKKIDYPKPDGVLSFDKPSSVFLSNTNHEENQPPHLVAKNPQLCIEKNWHLYAGPEARYCPAGVYEYLQDEAGAMKLQINAQNCVHCKTCDIKDPIQNIQWRAPQGGGGPIYEEM